MWVFAYGATLWREEFPFVQKVPGCVTGYVRRFWIATNDYVRLRNKPGRVVAMVPTLNPNDMVWGMCYEIDPKSEEHVAAELEISASTGFYKETATFYPVLSSRAQYTCTVKPFDVEIYVPTETNVLFMKDESVEDTATSIASAYGPAGSNAEYLYNLATEVKFIAPNYTDEYLAALESAVHKIQGDAEILLQIDTLLHPDKMLPAYSLMENVLLENDVLVDSNGVLQNNILVESDILMDRSPLLHRDPMMSAA